MATQAPRPEIAPLLINEKDSILSAIQRLNETASQLLLVVDDALVLHGTVTDGDIRRGIVAGKQLTLPVSEISNKTPKTLDHYDLAAARRIMRAHGVSRVPVVASSGMPVALIRLEEISEEDEGGDSPTNKVVIMAGGKGTRLEPITRIVPKPLLPVGDKPMIELIMDSFAKEGFRDFFVSINYKKEFIKTYIAERRDLMYNITCVEEDDFLGTAGSLKLMEKDLVETFFVSNCDILVDVRYRSALESHREEGNALTIVGALKKIRVPYGVIRMGENGGFSGIDEKPDLPLIVNTGVYILEPSVLSLISEKERIDMTDLISRVSVNGGKIGVFPVHRRWIDIGQWSEYKNALC